MYLHVMRLFTFQRPLASVQTVICLTLFAGPLHAQSPSEAIHGVHIAQMSASLSAQTVDRSWTEPRHGVDLNPWSRSNLILGVGHSKANRPLRISTAPWAAANTDKDGGVSYRVDSALAVQNDNRRYRYVPVFDIMGNLVQEIYNEWDSTLGQWLPDSKMETVYNGEGNPVEGSYFLFDPVTLEWINSARSEYTYDNDAQLGTLVNAIWSQEFEQWVNLSKFMYAYIPDGYAVEKVEQFYEDAQWVNVYRDSIIRNSSGKIVQWEVTQWVNGQWEPSLLIIYDYDENERLTGWDSQAWLELNDTLEWRDARWEEHIYDAWGNLAEVTRGLGNRDQGNITDQRQFTHDNTVPFEELILPFHDLNDIAAGYDFYEWTARVNNHMLLQDVWTYYADPSIGWVDTYYYSEVVNSVSHRDGWKEILAYPNPATESVRFEGLGAGSSLVTLYDLQGRIVLQQQLTGDVAISLAGLSEGLYAYELIGEGAPRKGRLVKQ